MPLTRDLVLGISRHHAKSANADWPEILARGIAAGVAVKVRVVNCDDYEELLGKVLASAVDVAWLPPLLHARAATQSAPLVALPQRGGWLTFRSALLVRKDDPVKDAGSLRGVRAAWRDRSSASGYLFPRLELAGLGAPPEKAFSSETFYGSVVEAADAVANRQADVCTCYVTDPAARDPQRAAAEIDKALGPAAQKLRVLHVSDPIPPDGFVVSPGVNAQERADITSALLNMHQTAEGKLALAEVLQADRLSPVNEALMRSLKSWSDAAAARAG